MSEDKKDRVDPTTLLPDEPMTYEIKKKKKKKKRKHHAVDPFKDIEELSQNPDELSTVLDPEVTIKVEDIEVDLGFDKFDDTSSPPSVQTEEQAISIQEQKNQNALILTFENVIGSNSIFNCMNTIEEQNDVHMCDVCHIVFKTYRNLLLHKRNKHKTQNKSFIYTCDDCGLSYDKKASLITHRRRKHNPDIKPEDDVERNCDICALVFKGHMRLRMHMRRKHGAYVESFKHKCKDCGLTYENYRSLSVHRKRKHTKLGRKKPEWYKCPECAKVFNKRETYVRHLQRKQERQKKLIPKELLENLKEINTSGEIPCKECPLVFSSIGYLKIHMRRKHNAYNEDFKLKCKVCGLSYEKTESLKRHINRKHAGRDHFCNGCNKEFKSVDELVNHKHDKPIVECNICSTIFLSQGSLEKHMRCIHKVDIGQVTVYCKVCGLGFNNNRQMKMHLKKVHLKVTYPCKFCKKNFKTKESFRRHSMKFHAVNYSNGSSYDCVMCPSETFASEFELCRHINATHTSSIKKEGETEIKKETTEPIESEPQSYHCTKCTEVCTNWQEIKKHYEDYHHIPEEIQCQACGELLPAKELQKHMKLKHPVVTNLKCSYCNFETTSKVSLTQHTLRHKNAQTINCEYPGCRYKSYYQAAMDKHKIKHAELGKKLQCSQCPFQSMNKYILRYHEEVHITGKKKYACDECDYATILPANLVQHKYKHASVKKFKCEYCPFASKYNTSLRFHVKTKHCDLPFPVVK